MVPRQGRRRLKRDDLGETSQLAGASNLVKGFIARSKPGETADSYFRRLGCSADGVAIPILPPVGRSRYAVVV